MELLRERCRRTRLRSWVVSVLETDGGPLAGMSRRVLEQHIFGALFFYLPLSEGSCSPLNQSTKCGTLSAIYRLSKGCPYSYTRRTAVARISMRQEGSVPSVNSFVGTIPGFASLRTSEQTDLLAYYLLAILGREQFAPVEIVDLRKRVSVAPHVGIAAYLSNGLRKRGNKPGKFVRMDKGYTLELGSRGEIAQQFLGRPAAGIVAKALRDELGSMTNPDAAAYMTEAVSCFEYGLFRAAIVLTWCVVYSTFRDWVFNKQLATFNAVSSGWKVPVTIRSIEDFQDLNEATVIDTARKAGLLSKEIHKTLKHLLDQRNSYAHPSRKPVRSSIAEAYIETTFQEVMPAFK